MCLFQESLSVVRRQYAAVDVCADFFFSSHFFSVHRTVGRSVVNRRALVLSSRGMAFAYRIHYIIAHTEEMKHNRNTNGYIYIFAIR